MVNVIRGRGATRGGGTAGFRNSGDVLGLRADNFDFTAMPAGRGATGGLAGTTNAAAGGAFKAGLCMRADVFAGMEDKWL